MRRFAVWGFGTNRSLECTRLPRCDCSFSGQQRYVTLTATPYKCKRQPYALATFVPVAAGLTRKNPIPIGTAHTIGNGYTWRVDSAQANVPLSSAPATGEEYFDADVTLTYTRPGSSIPLDHLDLNAETRLGQVDNADHGGGCPASDLQPRLDIVDPIVSGQSVTGHVCWTIATGDAAGLEMYFGSGTLNFLPATTWFAVH